MKPGFRTETKNEAQDTAFRIIDANLNRLREGLRSAEEYFRFSGRGDNAGTAAEFRAVRSLVKQGASSIPQNMLLENRMTGTDPFAEPDPGIDPVRENIEDIVKAGLKRAQEASRVIEEYSLVLDERIQESGTVLSSLFKRVRFKLYNLEKEIMI